MARRINVDFQEFKKTWANTNGYFPVYVYGDEDFEESGFVQILLDMVINFRLLDGKILVLAVKMEEKDLPEFRQYLSMMGDQWKKEMDKTNEDLLQFTNNFK